MTGVKELEVSGAHAVVHFSEGITGAPYGELVSLRAECWKGHIHDLRLLEDGHDQHALHWWVEAEGQVIGSARLCIHPDLRSVPAPHLYSHLPFDFFPVGIGCINRLVVDVRWRGNGLAQVLDNAREDAARIRGCKSMIVVWNPASHEGRRSALIARGFHSLSDNRPIQDGEFGVSYPFGKSLIPGNGAIDSAAIGGPSGDTAPARG
jgi:GNAT superfamily N-acetyltransferase